MAKRIKLEILTVFAVNSEGKYHDLIFHLSRNGPALSATSDTIRLRANTADRAIKHLSDRYRCTKIVRADQLIAEAVATAADTVAAS